MSSFYRAKPEQLFSDSEGAWKLQNLDKDQIFAVYVNRAWETEKHQSVRIEGSKIKTTVTYNILQ